MYDAWSKAFFHQQCFFCHLQHKTTNIVHVFHGVSIFFFILSTFANSISLILHHYDSAKFCLQILDFLHSLCQRLVFQYCFIFTSPKVFHFPTTIFTKGVGYNGKVETKEYFVKRYLECVFSVLCFSYYWLRNISLKFKHLQKNSLLTIMAKN